jgi:hypothetical protein
LATTVAWPGCKTPETGDDSPLKKPQMPPDTVVLEIFRVQFPFGDPRVNFDLWQEVDELHFPVETRQRLARNGFRVGLVGGQLPTGLSELLQLHERPSSAGQANQVHLADLASQPRVERMRMQIRTADPGKITVSDVHRELQVLLCDDHGRVSGQPYRDAQAFLEITTTPENDGRVRADLAPELQHDGLRREYVGDQATGIIRCEMARPRKVFDQLGFSAVLAPGSMLLITSLPDRPGSLGHHFLTAEDGSLRQKMLVIRLAQTQHSPLFVPPKVLPLR